MAVAVGLVNMARSAHLQSRFAPQCFRTAVRQQYPNRPHTHGFHEIVQCAEGEGVQHAGQAWWPVEAGDVLFLPAGLEHVAAPKAEESLVLDVLYFQASSAGEALAQNPAAMAVLQHLQHRVEAGDCTVPLTADSRETVADIFRRLVSEDSDRLPSHDMAMTLLLQQLMLVFLRDPNLLPHFVDRFGGDSTLGRIQRVESYIQTHYMQPLTVEQMASLACLGRSQFHAIFKATTGKTLVAYIQAVRIDRAMALLADGDLPILEVAMRSGFENLSHFYHVFKAHTGCPPGAFTHAAEPRRNFS